MNICRLWFFIYVKCTETFLRCMQCAYITSFRFNSTTASTSSYSIEWSEIFNFITGRVYIGAVNKLYQLSHDLGLTANAITGPKEDSPLCSVLPDCPSNVEKKLTNNVNKALVIDYAESRIIECGSLFQVIFLDTLNWIFVTKL